ncbi:hypothetical protein GN316_07565 [Xylophilus sp. Kf1]|nr:hypothetical protein [Xylophilus sp. Kf1]
MTYIAWSLFVLYLFFGLLFYGLSRAARRADNHDARARAITKLNLRRRHAAMAESHLSPSDISKTVV